jgi:hypothetical protein
MSALIGQPRRVIWISAAVVLGLGLMALAQGKPAKPAAERVRLEYLHQEVQADALVQNLNDLDGQGWEVFQIVPGWAIKSENSESVLVPKAYQVFGRRPKDAK